MKIRSSRPNALALASLLVRTAVAGWLMGATYPWLLCLLTECCGGIYHVLRGSANATVTMLVAHLFTTYVIAALFCVLPFRLPWRVTAASAAAWGIVHWLAYARFVRHPNEESVRYQLLVLFLCGANVVAWWVDRQKRLGFRRYLIGPLRRKKRDLRCEPRSWGITSEASASSATRCS